MNSCVWNRCVENEKKKWKSTWKRKEVKCEKKMMKRSHGSRQYTVCAWKMYGQWFAKWHRFQFNGFNQRICLNSSCWLHAVGTYTNDRHIGHRPIQWAKGKRMIEISVECFGMHAIVFQIFLAQMLTDWLSSFLRTVVEPGSLTWALKLVFLRSRRFMISKFN